MSSWERFMQEYAECYRTMQRILKFDLEKRDSPKQYGEYLQKKKKRGKRK